MSGYTNIFSNTFHQAGIDSSGAAVIPNQNAQQGQPLRRVGAWSIAQPTSVAQQQPQHNPAVPVRPQAGQEPLFAAGFNNPKFASPNPNAPLPPQHQPPPPVPQPLHQQALAAASKSAAPSKARRAIGGRREGAGSSNVASSSASLAAFTVATSGVESTNASGTSTPRIGVVSTPDVIAPPPAAAVGPVASAMQRADDDLFEASSPRLHRMQSSPNFSTRNAFSDLSAKGNDKLGNSLQDRNSSKADVGANLGQRMTLDVSSASPSLPESKRNAAEVPEAAQVSYTEPPPSPSVSTALSKTGSFRQQPSATANSSSQAAQARSSTQESQRPHRKAGRGSISFDEDSIEMLSATAVATPEAGVSSPSRWTGASRRDSGASTPLKGYMLGTQATKGKYSRPTSPGGSSAGAGTPRNRRGSRPVFHVAARNDDAADRLTGPAPATRPAVEASAVRARETVRTVTENMSTLNAKLAIYTREHHALHEEAEALHAEIKTTSAERDALAVKLNSLCDSMGAGLQELVEEAARKRRIVEEARAENARLRKELAAAGASTATHLR